MMWRALLLAIGVSLCIVGGECLVVEKVVLAKPGSRPNSSDYGQIDLNYTTSRRVLVPPEWAPWALLASGTITVLYSASLSGSGD